MAAKSSKNNRPKALWRRIGQTMVAANDVAEAMLRTLNETAIYIGEFHGARSIKQLRLWWALQTLLVDADIFPTQKAASDATKIACGHVDIAIMPDTGEVNMIPQSIAFESLRQDEFNVIFEAALDVITHRWLEGVDKDELRRQAFKMIDPPWAIGERVER